ncbi:2,4-dienoyl-CoA reductase-like NADH-dependent reductase (Old Yellow Enzyme family) [Paraburkholderia sp. MM6662-R1]
MAPMTTWSSNADGTVSDQEVAYYRARSTGVGMLLTGCTHVTVNGVGFTDEFAAYDDRFIPSLRRLGEAARICGASAVLQIFHAGNKAVSSLVPDGRIVGASALKAPVGPFNDGEVTSHALTRGEINEIVRAFAKPRAAPSRRASKVLNCMVPMDSSSRTSSRRSLTSAMTSGRLA